MNQILGTITLGAIGLAGVATANPEISATAFAAWLAWLTARMTRLEKLLERRR